MSLDELKLNLNQQKAVAWQSGPLLVLAGPGSGKTFVLTLRVARLVNQSPEQRFRILGLTFTTKAASEMRDRVDQLAPEARDRVLLTTFHSFAADILRQHGSHVGIDPDFTILAEESDRTEVLQDAIRSLASHNVSVDESDLRLLPLITDLLEKFVPDDKIRSTIHDAELAEKVAVLYREYRRQLVSNNRLDFPSLLSFAYEVLRTKPAIARQLRVIYPHICVDEFQDTNFAQYQLLRAVVGGVPGDLFVVADDDQILYQWNGASPERLQELRDDYQMAVIQLPDNFRCPPAVIRLANRLIKHNPGRSPEREDLSATKADEGGDVVRLKGFESQEEETEWVTKDVALLGEQARGNTAVLARSRALAEQIAAGLNAHGISASFSIKKTEFQSAPLRWLHSMLRLANARGDQEQLRRACKAFYDLEGIDIRARDIIAAASANGGDLLRSWVAAVLARGPSVGPEARNLLENQTRNLADRMDFTPFVPAAFAWFSHLEHTLADQGHTAFTDFSEESTTWSILYDAIIKRFGAENVSLNLLLQELDLSPKSPPVPPNAVRCLTIHTAKGLEFDNVYLVGMAEEILPSYQSIKKGNASREMQEERRSCFVAVTRTCSRLTLTFSKTYSGWRKEPSRFLREMGLIT